MRFLVLFVITGCGFSKSADAVIVDARQIDAAIDAAIDAVNIDGAPGSARKKRITIPDAKVFGNLQDFPIWLVIDDNDLGARATAAGDDIYFTRTNGTPLEWQRVAWNKASGHLEAWVKVDLTDGGPSELDLRYGDPGPAHAPNAPMVWTNGFVAVWHLDDLLTNTTITDARGTVMGTAVGGPTSVMTGKLGRAIDFDGSDDEVTFTNPINGNTSSTISAWVRITAPAQGFSSILTVGNPAGFQARFVHTNYGGLSNGFYGDDLQSSISVHNNTFTLIHSVFDSAAGTSTIYRDGLAIASRTIVGTVNTQGTGGKIGNAPMQFGPGGNTLNFINGVMDEVRIANAPRSLAWIQTEHANQDDVDTFFSLGPEQQAP